MARQNLEEKHDWGFVDQVMRHPVALAGSAFALGFVAGRILTGASEHISERARAMRAHREYERTVAYDENLPDTLTRREPPPGPDQPRFGGTGALGAPPTSVGTALPREPDERR